MKTKTKTKSGVSSQKPEAPHENGRVYALRKDLRPDPFNLRKDFPEAKLLELSENISANGIEEDLLVRPDAEKKTKFMIVDGERRWRAAELAKIDRLPIRVRAMTDDEARKYQRITGTQRENLTALEEAADLAKQLAARQAKDPKFTPELLGKELGIKRGTIYNRLKLTRLHEPLRVALTEGKIDVMVAAEASRIPDPAVQAVFVKEVTNTEDRRFPFSFRAVQELIDEKYVRQLTDAPFDTEDAKLAPKCGACSVCPKLSGNMKALFPEIKNGKICTDLKCFGAKVEAHNAKVMVAAKEKGQTVLSEKESADIFYGEEYGSRAGEVKSYEDYIDLNDRCQPMGHDHQKPWKTALGKQCPQPVIAVDPLGGLHELLKKSVAMEALKAAGWKPERESYSGGMSAADKAAQKARAEKTKLFRATLAAAIPQILEKVTSGTTVTDKLWALLAQAAYDRCSIERHDFIAKRMGLSTKVSESRDALDKWFKQPNHSPADYMRFTVEILLLASAEHGYSKIEWDETALATARLAGVDLNKTTQQLKLWKEMGHTGYGQEIAEARSLTNEIKKIIEGIKPEDGHILHESMKKPGGLAPDVYEAVTKQLKKIGGGGGRKVKAKGKKK